MLSATTGYQLRAFNDAADDLGVELIFATDRCHQLDDPWQDRAIAVRFHDTEASLDEIVRAAAPRPVRGVIAVGDRPVVLAAHAAAALGIPWHPPAAAAASANKLEARRRFADAGLPSPWFSSLRLNREPRTGNREPARFPCVLKPLGLSGSRGVIRADDRRSFDAALDRIARLLSRGDVRAARTGLEDTVIVEEFIPGREFAIEGVLTHGAFTAFAIFDKPDPLDGPFFEETIYVTPSRLPPGGQADLVAAVARGAAALGLAHGPVHAECRVNDRGVFLLEIAARPIGGLCSRVLRFEPWRRGCRVPRDGALCSLEHVLLEHAVGRPIDGYRRERRASAVMMIPIPARGLLKDVRGEAEARAVGGVDEIRITAKPDQLLEPLPEAASYLGFIFARGDDAAPAERAVREAHARLEFDVAREIPVASRR
jgi:ATP-grasp domain/L-amino acid ligase C-terminal domain 2/ATP-grasp N-terminal domain